MQVRVLLSVLLLWLCRLCLLLLCLLCPLLRIVCDPVAKCRVCPKVAQCLPLCLKLPVCLPKLLPRCVHLLHCPLLCPLQLFLCCAELTLCVVQPLQCSPEILLRFREGRHVSVGHLFST